ncbi:hypothetical protein [Bradymonas sediminis]|uniref:Uncharacterized protein n=1 Tax=Bradymonas sediminis TaxID=1548548 RepID=A0A2Z4FNI5_9DELT|nr:hypothetical protein [Bradymonas sediminis]AWV90557.1 hypothetical protein DN745_14965 [Bradymonas sediminis]TDP72047.1 hypothetical protein DFR33_10727 [Bradymonas sediminis]
MTQDAVETTQDKKDPTQELAEALYQQLKTHARRVKRTEKLLKQVQGKAPSPATFTDWLDIAQSLEGYALGVPELDAQREALLKQIDSGMQKLRLKTRMTFFAELEKRAAESNIKLQKLSDTPYVAYADPMTLEVDFDLGCTRVLYGHELICEVELDARKLLDARENALKEIKKQALDSEEFFNALHASYRTVLAAEGLPYGERVDLVDVLMPMSMMRLSRANWRKKGVDALQPFTRHQLAWQLSQLRRDAMLEHDGKRLDIGAATGGSTRDKRNVLYIPIGSGNGQYYRSIRFTAAPAA